MPMHPDFVKILLQFKQRYGDEKGTSLFYAWLNKRGLDDSKPYSNAQLLKKKECLTGKCTRSCGKCLRESFQWAKPLIKLLKEDKTGKTYQVEAHFAVTSMNRSIYTKEELMQAVSTLPGKHVDLNHKVEWVINGVEVLAAAWEDGAVEVLLHVDNGVTDAKNRDVQAAIEGGVIDCVSIEGDAAAMNSTDEGNEPLGFYYTGLALLDQDALPGIPLTTIQPMENLVEQFYSESLNLESGSTHSGEVKEMSENTKSKTVKKEANAQFCPVCGQELDADGICQNKDCAAYGKTVQMNAVKSTTGETVKIKLELEQKTKEATDAKALVAAKNVDLIADNEAIAKKDLAIAEALEKQKIMQEQNIKLTEDLGKSNIKRNEFEGRLREAETRISQRDSKIDELQKDKELLAESVGNLTAARESAESEKNTAVSEAAKSESRANSEIESRAKIQRELAELREKLAGAIKRESEASEKLAEESRKVLDLETENVKLHEEIHRRDTDIAEKQRIIDKALIENKRVYKILKENNIYEVKPDGTLNVPT